MFSVGASCKCSVSSHRRMSLSSTWLGSSSSSAIRQIRFPDSATLGRISRRNYVWKAKAEYFGVDLKTDITVENDTVGPCSKIKGELLIDTKFPIEHDGIIVQLEAFCSLSYSTKFNERTSAHKGKGCILENTKVNTYGLLESPIKCEIIPITPPEFGGHSINSGVWHYPFQLQIPLSISLPAPFQSSFGDLNYKIVIYMVSHSTSAYVQLAEQNIKCDGHFNLYDLEESSKPIVIEQYYRKSYFHSQKKQVKGTLSVKTSGFLQKEDIPFSLFIKNPKCAPLHLSVNLQQHVKYQATTNLASVVKIVTTVESQERDECDDPKPEIQWTGNIRIPENQAPTYACNSMYSVNYILEFQVKSQEEEVILTGQSRILLGTTRDPIKPEESSSEDSSNVPPPPGELYRSGSESSIHSQRSIYSTPIAYSVPANLNLSIDEPETDEEDDENDQQQNEDQPTSSSHLRPNSSPSPRHQRSQSHHDITETLQEEEEDVMEPFSSVPYTATSVNSLLSTQTALTLPPSYSQLSSRIPSTETLPPTYADLDLNVEPPASLIIGDAVDLEKRYSINLDTLNLQDEYQVTFYSV